MISTLFISTVFGHGAYQSTSRSNQGMSCTRSRMHQMQQQHPDKLPSDERHVYHMLSPLYQRIYLYALDSDQREMVAVFERRGENPYHVIDNILKRDRQRSDQSYDKKCSPCERSIRSKEKKKYIISEQKKADIDTKQTESVKEDESLMYEEKEVEVDPKQIQAEKEILARKYASKCPGCNTCKNCRTKKPKAKTYSKPKPSFLSRCKAYLKSNNNRKKTKPNWKKYKYIEPYERNASSYRK